MMTKTRKNVFSTNVLLYFRLWRSFHKCVRRKLRKKMFQKKHGKNQSQNNEK